MKIKKVLALILACVLSLSVLAGCGGNTTQSGGNASSGGDASASGTGDTSTPAEDSSLVPAEGTSEETLRVACDGEPTSIFPNYVTNKTSNRVDRCMFALRKRKLPE